MDTKLATRDIRLQQWMAIFNDRAQSGLSVKRYCEEHGISRNRYCYWLKVARETALQSSGQTTFVELKAPEPVKPKPRKASRQFKPKLTITTDRFTIGIDAGTPKELLAMALEVLSDAQ